MVADKHTLVLFAQKGGKKSSLNPNANTRRFTLLPRIYPRALHAMGTIIQAPGPREGAGTSGDRGGTQIRRLKFYVMETFQGPHRGAKTHVPVKTQMRGQTDLSSS